MTDAVVVTISDSAVAGARVDTSGPEACRLLTAAGFAVRGPLLVADDRDAIAALLRESAADARLVVTTGGTGLALRDVTPEATRDVIEREVPGLAELMRAHGVQQTPRAALSRGVVGTLGTTLIVNLPGSPRAVTHALGVITPVLHHALALLAGNTEH